MLYRKRRIIPGLTLFLLLVSLVLSSSSLAFPKPNWLHIQDKTDANFWSQMSQDFAIESQENNPDIQRQIHWYQQHPKHLQRILMRAEPFLRYVYQQTHHYNLPAELALIPLLESQYNPAAGARSGPAGLWQMMPGTAAKFGLKVNRGYDGRRDVNASTKAALTYLTYLHRYFNQNWLLALAAYNAGEGKIAAVSSRHNFNFWNLPPSRETREYVPKILALASIIRQPGLYKVSLPNLAKNSEVSEETWKEAKTYSLAENNQSQASAPQPTQDHGEPKAEQTMASLPLPETNNTQPLMQTMPIPEPQVSTIQYHVKQHDTLGHVAKKFQTTSDAIKKSNHLKTNKLKIGQVLIITSAEKKHTATTKAHQSKQSKKTYTLKSGDSLETIAKKLHVPLKKLQQANHIKNTKRLQIGQTLTIPSH